MVAYSLSLISAFNGSFLELRYLLVRCNKQIKLTSKSSPL